MAETAAQARARRSAIRHIKLDDTLLLKKVLHNLRPPEEDDYLASDLGIDKLVLDGLRRVRIRKRGKKRRRVVGDDIKVRVEEALVDAVVERTIEGASTLTLTINDPEWVLVASGIFDADDNGRLDPIDVKLDKLWFRIVKVNPTGSTLSLVFEDREVAILRGYDKPRSVSRADKTRAQFIELLLREVKNVRIKFHSPEKNRVQPIGRIRTSQDKRGSSRSRGLHRGQAITVKGKAADAGQRRILEIALEELDFAGGGGKASGEGGEVPERVWVALLIAIIQESLARNLPGGDDSSVGVLQALDMHGSVALRRNVRAMIRKFLLHGFAISIGAIAYARQNPSASPAEIAAAIQGNRNGASDYAPWVNEARNIIDAWGGTGKGGGLHASRVRIKQYRFRRGERGKREDSWTCIQRLAGEVRWRAFMRKGELWYATETWLLKQRVMAVISRTSPGVDTGSFSFDWDTGKAVKEVSFNILATRWQFPPGAVIKVEKSGPANGRWLVAKIRKSLYSPNAQITLRKAVKPKPEPAPETESTGGGGGSSRGGSIRERIVSAAEATMTTKTRYNRYSLSGALTADPTPAAPARSDCSQWARAIYLRAGAQDPGTNTWAQVARGRRTTNPRPGDLVFPTQQGHVEIYVGSGKTIGHGSPPIDGWSIPGMRSYFGSVFFVTYDFLD